jgi:hypothetical protein
MLCVFSHIKLSFWAVLSGVFFVSLRIYMRYEMLLSCFVVIGLSACAQPRVVAADPTESGKSNINQAFGEKCEDAKYQLDKTVQEGQLSELRELKRNIELYCVWRRN